jgi:glycosyltransferase involved in cell wall biosynthesis
MRVCFISEGQSLHTQRWTGSLARAGCEIHLISSFAVDIPGVVLHHFPIYSPNPWFQMKNNISIRKLLQGLNPDITHLFGLFSVSSLGAMWLIRGLKNLVISVWGSDVKPAKDQETFKEKAIKRYLLNRGDCLVAISKYLSEEVKLYLDHPREIKIVPWGVDLDIFRPLTRDENPETVRIGFAKRLHYLSGPDILLRAFKYAHDRFKGKLVLKIAGSGPMEQQLKQESNELGLTESIEWAGWIGTPERLRDFYYSIDLFVMPSRRESFGVSALEASATGLPVIASRFGGIPEIVSHGETGLLAEPEDAEGIGEAIIALSKDGNLRKAMGIRGRKRAEKEFDWNDSIKSMMEIYRQISRK